MQLRELNLKRFGVFSDTAVPGLKPGFNLLFGENEAGKTTLLQFVRWVLFGEDAMHADQFAPAAGGTQQGRLECETAGGESLTIERAVKSKRKTRVTVSTPSRTLEEQENLNPFLGHASGTLFRNLYAITLDELASLDLVVGGEVKDRIVGAGLGLGAVSLPKVRNALETRRDALFRERGKKQTINALTQEIHQLELRIGRMQEDLVQYDRLHEEIKQLTEQRDALKTPFEEANRTLQKLSAMQALYPDFVKWKEDQNALESLDGVPDLGDSAVEEFRGLRSELKSLEEEYAQKARKLDPLQAQCDGIEVNAALLEQEAEAKALNHSLESVRHVVEEVETVRAERRDKDGILHQHLPRIGPGWDEAALQRFHKSDEIKSRARDQQSELEAASNNVSAARNKLELYLERRAQEDAARSKAPPGILLIIVLFGGLSVTGGVAAWLAGFVWGAALGALGLALSAIAFGWVKRQSAAVPQTDPLEVRYREAVEEAEAFRQRLQETWERWLTDQEFHAGLGPMEVLDLAGTIRHLQEVLRERRSLDERLGKMEGELQTARGRVERLAAAVPDFTLNEDVRINIELLLARYEEQAQNRTQYEQAAASLNEHRQALKDLEQRMDARRQALNALILRAGAKDEEGFRQQVDAWKQARELKQRIETARGLIQSRVGMGEAFEAFVGEMEAIDPDRIAAALAHEQEQVEALQRQREELNQTLGERHQEQKTLANRDELFALQSELEMKKHRLHRAARDWAVAALALDVLDRSLKSYQETHQPAVYRAASDWFRTITGGAYESVRYQMETDVVDVRAAGGEFKPVEHLSRGTREQLYLALRLALIQEYEKDSEPLPVLMDDVWVNFDDARRDRFVAVLAEFAKGRQVVVLSCHQASRELCLRHGAHEARLPGA